MSELRRYQRAAIDVPLQFAARGSDEKLQGHARDISVGGMFVVTEAPLPFSTQIVIEVILPGQKSAVRLPGVVRWSGASGMGVQFGPIGARETHAITELVK